MAAVDEVSCGALCGEWSLTGEFGSVLPEMSDTTWCSLSCETERGFDGSRREFGLKGAEGHFGGLSDGSGGSGSNRVL